MTKAELHRAYVRTSWKLAVQFPPALRILAHVEPPANDEGPWSPLGGAA